MIERIQIMCGDFADSIKRMPNESIGILFRAIWAYALDEEYEEIVRSDPRVETLFPVIQCQIDRNEKYRLLMVSNGRKGGAPAGNKNAKKQPNSTKINQNQPNSTKDNQKQAPSPSPCPSPKPLKNIYGVRENVLLTDEEHQKVIDAGLTDLIDELSLYIDSKGAKYKSHYSTILAWARRREKENKGNGKTYQFQQMQKTDYDMDALERRLVKN